MIPDPEEVRMALDLLRVELYPEHPDDGVKVRLVTETVGRLGLDRAYQFDRMKNCHSAAACAQVAWALETLVNAAIENMLHVDGVTRTVVNLSYTEWLANQTDALQDNILGCDRAAKFRDGSLSLAEITQPEPEAFDYGTLCSCSGPISRLGEWHTEPKGWTCNDCNGFIPRSVAHP